MSLLGVPNFGVEVAKYLEREQHRRTAVSYRIYVDSFETDFAGLKRKQMRDKDLVLQIAKRCKRYSTFEMTQPLMDTLQELERDGHFRIDVENSTYPWVDLVFPPPPEVK